MTEVRVRFAPSPTGPLHVGGVRTALYNYLFARKNRGTFILRIEDTDQTRYVPGAEEYIFESLKWLGLNFDEGPGKGGEFEPYRQSERKLLYRQYADKMLKDGNAYLAFDSPKELEAKRLEYEQQGKVFKYDCQTRLLMKNSISLTEQETVNLIKEGHPYVIRIKIPDNREIRFNDIIRGEVVFNSHELDDKVLLKADGLPTYHLANVTDDYLMKISHVIRGEEWLPSAPLHVLLYEFLGWQNVRPAFAHLPLIMKPNGKGKLSKRDGDAGGFPVFLLEWTDPFSGEMYSGYRESGYLPDAVINILAFLGWNPGTEKELFSLDELVNEFSLERVGKSGSRFDPEKAKWYNHQFIQNTDNQYFVGLLRELFADKALIYSDKELEKIVSLVKDRLYFINDLSINTQYFFNAPDSYDENFRLKKWKENTDSVLADLAHFLSTIDSFSSEDLHLSIKDFIDEKQWNMGDVMNPLRFCLVGSQSGIHLFELLAVLGKEESIGRIRKVIHKA